MNQKKPRAKNKPKVKIPCSNQVESGMSKFLPTFRIGNKDDMHIVKQYEKIQKMLGEIRSEVYRDLIRTKQTKKMTPKMKEIYEMEQKLAVTLSER